MDSRTLLKRIFAVTALSMLLSACGGGGGDEGAENPPTGDTTAPNAPTSTVVTSASNGSITLAGRAEAGSTVTVTFPDGIQKTSTADADGNYSISSAPSQAGGFIKVTSTDDDGNISKPATVAAKEVNKTLYKATAVMPELSFKPSLGINTEAPQGGADTVGMSMPFVDIFRTARPFAELSGNITFDQNGWPTEPGRTKLLQGTLKDSIPSGQYTVIYDGSGILEFGSGGAVSNVQKIMGENKYTFDLTLRGFDTENEVAAADTNAFNLNVKGVSAGAGNYIKNIRIVMPGGTCTENPYITVASASECPNSTTYQSFVERLEVDRNAIIFNPDYLLFLRNFKVVRMMNLMEASLKKLCFSAESCPAEVGTWADRAKLDDAVWGGNDARTSHEDHKGVPVEVMIALANTLKRDIWVNMPHVATNDYVTRFAKMVYADLDPSLTVYLEYSNEVWNPGFAGHAYTTSEGKKLGLGDVPSEFVGSNRDEDYFARLRFYSKRAVEIFTRWEDEFGGSNNRLVRVLGSFIGDKVLTKQMLENVNTNSVDRIAIAPYFFGCPYKAICIDAPKTLLKATTVDDVFDAIDQSGTVDVKSLEGTIDAVKNQLTVVTSYGLKLITYEGGQHLVTGVLGDKVLDSDKPRLRKLFNDANRDPRMKERYITFLNAWKDLSNEGTDLFTLYTMPQSYYRFGNFGLKEHLNKARGDSPKFDGVMTFQESAGN